jgi:hypothetical protein
LRARFLDHIQGDAVTNSSVNPHPFNVLTVRSGTSAPDPEQLRIVFELEHHERHKGWPLDSTYPIGAAELGQIRRELEA